MTFSFVAGALGVLPVSFPIHILPLGPLSVVTRWISKPLRGPREMSALSQLLFVVSMPLLHLVSHFCPSPLGSDEKLLTVALEV